MIWNFKIVILLAFMGWATIQLPIDSQSNYELIVKQKHKIGSLWFGRQKVCKVDIVVIVLKIKIWDQYAQI